MMDCVSNEIVYRKNDYSMMILLLMVSIHMKINEDGGNVDQEVGKGSM
jgi:hypothetical protein